MSKTQRDEGLEKIKRIFYTNITYGCNSNCVFCYSHNTKHIKDTYNEVSRKLDFLVCKYEKSYEPLTNFGSASIEAPEKWTSNPWPWDNK